LQSWNVGDQSSSYSKPPLDLKEHNIPYCCSVILALLKRISHREWPQKLPGGTLLAGLVSLISGMLLVPVLYVSRYNQPCPADDYANSNWQHLGSTLQTMYFHWSGRYFNNLALLFCPLHWHSYLAYRLVILAAMLLLILAFVLVIYKALRKYVGASGWIALAVGMSAALLLINNMASLAEGFFWYAGMVTYTLPLICFLCFLLLVIQRDGHLENAFPWTPFLAVCLLIICVIGGNETLLLMTDCSCLLIWYFYRSHQQKDSARFYKFLLVVAMIATVIAVLAPGNFQRQSVNPRNLWMLVPAWCYDSQKLAFQWILDPFLMGFSILFLLLLRPYPVKRPTNLLLAISIPLVLILVLSFPVHFALGTGAPPRVLNCIYLFFLLGWMYFLLQLQWYAWELIRNSSLPVHLFRNGCLLLAGLVLLISLNTHDLRSSQVFQVCKGLIRKVPQQYFAEVNARYDRIQASPTDSVAVPDLKFKQGNVLYLADIISRASSGSNRSLARYYGKKAVYIAPDSVFRR